MTAPDFVVIGHAVRDLTPEGWRLGGTVSFAAVQAHRLGRSVGLVTRAAADLDLKAALPFASIVQAPSEVTTTFENVYRAAQRSQRVTQRAAPIEEADVPDAWLEARTVLLGPVLGELSAGFASRFRQQSLVGVSAQGWLRDVDDGQHVVQVNWTGEPFWRACDVLFVSDEDLTSGRGELDRWTREVPVVAMTESWKGARVHASGRWRRIEAFPEHEVDPTGAGDTFATAFLIRLQETADVDEAARFGAAAASLAVGGVGIEQVPTRDEVEARLRMFPEIALR